MTHTNYAASGASVFALATDGAQALAYGGYYAPRAMASTTMAFVWIALAFLRLFYLRYSEHLEELSLLWHPEMASFAQESGVRWDHLLELFEAIAKQLHEEILEVPEDDVWTPEWATEIHSGRDS